MRILVLALLALVHAWGAPGPGPSAPTSIFDPSGAAGLGVKGHIGAKRGSLDKEIIRRIIRGHINEVKDCYERALAKDPALFGRVMVQFTIAASGDVIASVLQSSTIGDESVESCTVAAVRRWQFPKPIGGGIVIVSYPFVFTPQGTFRLPGLPSSVAAVELESVGAASVVHRSFDVQRGWSNGLIWVSEEGLLLVDTAWTDAQTEAILSWGEKRLGKQWIGAVVTHEHNDRDGGIGALERRQIPIAALDLTVAKLEKRGVHSARVLFAAKDIAFKDPRGFEAFYPGPGHAPDNIVLRFPDVVFGGCLIKEGTAKTLGFTGDADLGSWPAAVSAVSARYGKTTVIPGHGAVDNDGKSYARTLELLRAAKK